MSINILRREFDRALKDLSNRKAPGIDRITVGLLRSVGDDILDRFFNLVGKIYVSGELPTDFKKSVIGMRQ